MNKVINYLLKDLIQFAASKNLDLLFVVKLCDYLLANINVNFENDEELVSYVESQLIISKLCLLLGVVTTEFSDTERTAYNEKIITDLLHQPERLEKFKEFKLSLYSKYYSSDIQLINSYIKEAGILNN